MKSSFRNEDLGSENKQIMKGKTSPELKRVIGERRRRNDVDAACMDIEHMFAHFVAA